MDAATEFGLLLALEVVAEASLLLLIVSTRREVKAAEQRAAERLHAELSKHAEAFNALSARIEELAASTPKKMRGSLDPRELVETKELVKDRAAATEISLLTQATEALGDRIGPAVIEWIRLNAPDAWARALRNPAMAHTIIEPAFRMAQRALAAAQQHGGTSSNPGTSGYMT